MRSSKIKILKTYLKKKKRWRKRKKKDKPKSKIKEKKKQKGSDGKDVVDIGSLYGN